MWCWSSYSFHGQLAPCLLALGSVLLRRHDVRGREEALGAITHALPPVLVNLVDVGDLVALAERELVVLGGIVVVRRDHDLAVVVPSSGSRRRRRGRRGGGSLGRGLDQLAVVRWEEARLALRVRALPPALVDLVDVREDLVLGEADLALLRCLVVVQRARGRAVRSTAGRSGLGLGLGLVLGLSLVSAGGGSGRSTDPRTSAGASSSGTDTGTGAAGKRRRGGGGGRLVVERELRLQTA